ncbi:hypothetical protein KCU71_g19, partial [Aureobasidium melanogenum]
MLGRELSADLAELKGGLGRAEKLTALTNQPHAGRISVILCKHWSTLNSDTTPPTYSLVDVYELFSPDADMFSRYHAR